MKLPLPEKLKQIFLLLFLFTIMTSVRVWFVTNLGLSDDEAYYWTWSRIPSLSYYDHPGLVAWLIYISGLVFHDSVFSVRFFSLLLNSCSWFLIWYIGRSFFGNMAALLTVILYAFTPIFSIGGLMMVPDGPMIFCWILTFYFAFQIFEKRHPKALAYRWILIGILIGIGTLAKYTMIFAGMSLFIFMIATPRARKQLSTPWPWIAVGIWAISCFPILYWNYLNHWASFRFQSIHRFNESSGFNFPRWGLFWLSQLGYLTPFVLIIFLATLAQGFRHWRDLKWRYIICFSLPTLAIFFLQAGFSNFKPHWPAPGYISLLIGSGFLLKRQWEKHRFLFLKVCFVFLLIFNLILYGELQYPLAPHFFKVVFHQKEWNPKWDPTNDLYGWSQASKLVRKLQDENIDSKGRLPFLATHRYQLSGELSFAIKEPVWTFSKGLDAYKFFKNYSNMDDLKGRSSIVIGDNRYEDSLHKGKTFSECEAAPELSIKRGPEIAKTFYFWVCKGFKGNI